MPMTRDLIHTDMVFKDGDGPEPGFVEAEGCGDGEIGLHMHHHADTAGDPFASLYLDPVGAALLGARLIAFARAEQHTPEKDD